MDVSMEFSIDDGVVPKLIFAAFMIDPDNDNDINERAQARAHEHACRRVVKFCYSMVKLLWRHQASGIDLQSKPDRCRHT
jgi:hypothetical protein